jgi:hypothetical protein
MLSWQAQQVIRNIKEKLLVLKDKSILLARNRNTWVVVFFIVLFASGFYINSYTGHMAELQKKSEQQFLACEKSLTTCETNATATQGQLNTCTSNLTKNQLNLATCTADKQQLENQYKNVSFDLLNCQQNYISVNTSYFSLTDDYELLAKNSATNICCKKKIDDNTLKYYYIESNSIVCTATASDKTKEFTSSCPILT